MAGSHTTARILVGLGVTIAFLTCFAGIARAVPPTAPTIREPSADDLTLNAFDVHMEVTGYADGLGDSDPHDCTEFEIRTTSGQVAWRTNPLCINPGDPKNHVHFGDGIFVNSHAGRSELLFDTPYLLYVRFRDTAGEVGGYSVRPFRTAPMPPPGSPSSLPWVPKQPGFAVEQIAGSLRLPVNVAAVPNPGTAPDSPVLYISELYGSIKTVTRSGAVLTYAGNLLNFDPTAPFPGSGEFGVTGVTVEPGTGRVLVSLVYFDAGDGVFYGRVVRFTSSDGGRTASGQETMLDLGLVNPPEPQRESHQISNLTYAPDGTVFLHQGDAFQPVKAPSDDSYLGKVLRFDPGNCGPGPGNPAAPNCAPPADNPIYNAGDGINARDYNYAKGFRNPFGGVWRAANNQHYVVENGPNVDRFSRVDFPPSGADEVPDYEWNGEDEDMFVNALYNWIPAHAPVSVAMVQPGVQGGSAFPASKQDHAFVTLSGPTYANGPQQDGKRIVELGPGPGGELGGPATELVVYDGVGRATASGLAAAADGLYFTDLYKDLDYSSPSDAGSRLLRIRYFPPTTTCTLNGRTLEVTLPGRKRTKKQDGGKAGAAKKKGKKRNRGPSKATIRRAGNTITVGGHWCGATVDNIEQIAVTGAKGSQEIRIDLRGGPFSPGATFEPGGEPEIEFGIDLRGGRDTLTILRRANAAIKANRRAASFNSDGDSDLVASRVEQLKLKPRNKRGKGKR